MRHARHRGALIEKWKESLRSVLPITAIVIALGLLAVPAPSGAMLAFLAGAVLLVVGMGLFTLGTDLAMIPIGEHVGAAIDVYKRQGCPGSGCSAGCRDDPPACRPGNRQGSCGRPPRPCSRQSRRRRCRCR